MRCTSLAKRITSQRSKVWSRSCSKMGMHLMRGFRWGWLFVGWGILREPFKKVTRRLSSNRTSSWCIRICLFSTCDQETRKRPSIMGFKPELLHGNRIWRSPLIRKAQRPPNFLWQKHHRSPIKHLRNSLTCLGRRISDIFF